MLNAQYALDHAEAGFTFLCVSPGVSMYHPLPELTTIKVNADALAVAENQSGWRVC